MIPQILDSTSIPLMEKLAAFTERRQEVLAENISNIDTPNYRRRDLPVQEFQAALKQAIKLKQMPKAEGEVNSQAYQLGLNHGDLLISPEMPAMGKNSIAEMSELFPREMLTPKVAENEDVIFRDNNNRSIEMLVMELTKNSMQHTFAIETMRTQMQMLETAISGRV
jgi:flagellar basal-body rod protein FlgB